MSVKITVNGATHDVETMKLIDAAGNETLATLMAGGLGSLKMIHRTFTLDEDITENGAIPINDTSDEEYINFVHDNLYSATPKIYMVVVSSRINHGVNGEFLWYAVTRPTQKPNGLANVSVQNAIIYNSSQGTELYRASANIGVQIATSNETVNAFMVTVKLDTYITVAKAGVYDAWLIVVDPADFPKD